MRFRRTKLGRGGFTVVELIAIGVVLAVLLAALAPTLLGLRAKARRERCMANCRQDALALTVYANDSKTWFAAVPAPPSLPLWRSQQRYGGLAGFFSLEQVGDGEARGYGGSTPGGLAYSDGNRTPLVASYLPSFGALVCPADARDRAGGDDASYPRGGTKRPRAPERAQDVVSYNLSYLYTAGFRTEESMVLGAAPIWGDETDGSDTGANAWYGAAGAPPGGSTAASIAAGAAAAGRYGSIDAHGRDGGNFLFSDGHGEFERGSVYDTFFRPPGPGARAPLGNVNAIDRSRFLRAQTID